MRLRVAVLVVVCGAGCGVHLDVPDSVTVSCASDSECPPGYTCSAVLHECIQPSSGVPPSVAEVSIVPAVTRRGQALAVYFNTDERLRRDPTVRLDDTAARSLAPIAPIAGFTYGFGTNDPDLVEGEYAIRATLTGDDGTVSPDVVLGTARFDFTAPALAGSSTVAERVVAGGHAATLQFSVTEPLAELPHASLSWATGEKSAAVVSQVGSTTFTLTYQSTGTEPATPASMVVSLVDLAGNQAIDTEAAVVSFDAVGPQLIDVVTRRRLLPGAANPLLEVSRVTHGTTVELFFAFNEPVVDDPDGTHYPIVRSAGPATLPFVESIAAGTTYVFTLTLDAGSYINGTYDIEVFARDAVGNLSQASLADRFDPAAALADRLDFVIDTAPPAPPAVSVSDRIVHVRTPWGADGALSSSRLVGQAGAVEACGLGQTICPFVVVYAFANLAQAVELGRGHVDANGAFDFVYSGVDFPDVYVTALDTAGNSSAVAGTAVRVRDGVWRATFGNKEAEQTAINPHRILRMPEPDLTGIRQRAALTIEQDDYRQLTARDDVVTSIRPVESWVTRQVTTVSDVPVPRHWGEMAAMHSAGALIMFGGQKITGGFSTDYDDLWQRTNRGWVQLFPVSSTPAARYGHGITYDARRDRIVLLLGTNYFESAAPQDFGDIWEYDGSVWRERCDDSPPSDTCPQRPSPRELFAFTYDEANGRSVIFGGTAQYNGGVFGETWAWDGTSWTQIFGGPSARTSPAMAYDGGRGNIVLYGGDDGSGPTSETWILSGSTWTHVFPATTPIAASDHRMVYDAHRDRVVMLTDREIGTGNVTHYDWNGSDWTPHLLPPGTVYSYYGTGAAYDPVLQLSFAFGGETSSLNTNILWSWDGATLTQVTTAAVSAVPGSGDVIYDEAAGKLLFFDFNSGQTWQFDGFTWRQLALATWPGGDGQMVYDSGRSLVVYYGGAAGNETWEFGNFGASCPVAEPRCWKQNGVTAPPLRAKPAVAYDRRRKRVVMHGGDDPAVAGQAGSNTTYELGVQGQCGNTLCWRLVASSGPSIFAAAMTYDELRGRTVLYGGQTGSTSNGDICNGVQPQACFALWEWDGYTWQQRTAASGPTPPGQRDLSVHYYDTRIGNTVFGYGVQGNGIGNQGSNFQTLWAWNGSTWRQLTVEPLGQPLPTGGQLPINFDRSTASAVLQTGTTWTRESGGGRATAVLAFDWQRSSIPVSAIIGLDMFVDGTSTSAPTTLRGTSAGGVDVRLWNAWTGGWGAVTRSTSAAVGTIDIGVDGAPARRYFDGSGTLLAQASSTHQGGGLVNTVDLDYVELEVRYRLDTTPACGDGVVDLTEACDDGNTTNDGNGCSATCTRIGSCGDGTVQSLFEQCDTGASNNNAIANRCRTTCTPARCGDGVVDSGEACDDGNTADSGNGCSPSCQRNDVCGDGVKTGSEGCDDGDAINDGRGCLANCTIDACCQTRAGGGCGGGSATIQNCVCVTNGLTSCCSGSWNAACVTAVTNYGCGTCSW